MLKDKINKYNITKINTHTQKLEKLDNAIYCHTKNDQKIPHKYDQCHTKYDHCHT